MKTILSGALVAALLMSGSAHAFYKNDCPYPQVRPLFGGECVALTTYKGQDGDKNKLEDATTEEAKPETPADPGGEGEQPGTENPTDPTDPGENPTDPGDDDGEHGNPGHGGHHGGGHGHGGGKGGGRGR